MANRGLRASPRPPYFGERDLAPLTPTCLAPGVWTTPLLTREGCEKLLADIDRNREDAADSAPNSMHERGTLLSSVGLAGIVDELVSTQLQDLVETEFHEVGGDSLDSHHSYLVEYGAGADEELGFHVDDSEVTLNLCLGDSFSGSELVLLGRRCDIHRQTPIDPSETLELDHEPGTCVLHFGRHRHRVDPIRRGRRRTLISWLRSSVIRGLAPSPASWCPHCTGTVPCG